MQFLSPEFQQYFTSLAQSHALPGIEETYQKAMNAATTEKALQILRAFGNELTFGEQPSLLPEHVVTLRGFMRQVKEATEVFQEEMHRLERKRPAEDEPERGVGSSKKRKT